MERIRWKSSYVARLPELRRNEEFSARTGNSIRDRTIVNARREKCEEGMHAVAFLPILSDVAGYNGPLLCRSRQWTGGAPRGAIRGIRRHAKAEMTNSILCVKVSAKVARKSASQGILSLRSAPCNFLAFVTLCTVLSRQHVPLYVSFSPSLSLFLPPSLQRISSCRISS